MAGKEIKFEYKGFAPASDFVAYSNERLQSVVRTAPFGATCLAEIELTPTGYKTIIKVNSGAAAFHGTSVATELEHSLQRCLGIVRSKTFKWRKEKLAQKNKPRGMTAEEKADPFARTKKKFYAG